MTGIVIRISSMASRAIHISVRKQSCAVDMLFLHNSGIEFFSSLRDRELYVDVGWLVFILRLQIDQLG